MSCFGRSCLPGLVVPGFVVALVVVAMMVWWKPKSPAPDRDFPIEVLLVDLSVFPEGWEVSTPPEPVPSTEIPLAEERVWVWFRYMPDPSTLLGASHHVYRFSSTWMAARQFRKYRPIDYATLFL